MKTWRKNLVAVAVLLVVCAGIYANWIYTEDAAVANLTDTLNEDKIMSADMLVINDSTLALDDAANTTINDYFAAVRMSRQEARDSAVSLLQEAMSYDDDAAAAQTKEQLELIVQTALCEAQIESLVIAKGYTDCVAYINDKGISVAVATAEGGLKQSDVAVIADIVMTQSEYTMKDIRVVEVQ